MAKDNDDGKKVSSLSLAKSHGVEQHSAGDLAKEIRARIADLNELVRVAVTRNVHVAFTVLEADEFADGEEYEELTAIISQRI